MNTLAIIPIFIGGMRGWQFIIVVLLIILLFGAKRIPTLMKSLGRSVHSFKEGMDEAKREMNRPVGQDNDQKEETKAKDVDR